MVLLEFNLIQIFIEIVEVYGYLGTFLISAFGSMIPFFSGPYLIPIIMFNGILNPTLLALTAGLGAAVGKTTSYLIGRSSGKYLIKSKYGKKFTVLTALFEKYGFVAVLIAAFTPIPDDFIVIPAGIAKYSVWKTFLGIFLGKTFLSLSVAWGLSTILKIIDIEGSTPLILSVFFLSMFFIFLLIYSRFNIEGWIEKKLL